MKRLLLLIPSILVGCLREMAPVGKPVDECQNEVEVVLDIMGSEFVKSSLTVDEYQVSDLALVVYRNGIMEYQEYFSSPGQAVKLSLLEGQSYNMYMMANTGSLPSYDREADFQKNCVYSIASIAEIKDRLPMAWNASGIMVHHGMGPIDVQLERLAAKVMFSLDKNGLEGLKVTSVNLCQCASSVRPFKYLDVAGSRAESLSEIIPGDKATSTDLAYINNGGKVYFYALENCQGILLPDNTLSSEKLPWRIGDRADMCTYLEVGCVFGNDGFLDGDVKYRFYLGLDSCSSFDVPGNACIDVKLQLTDAGLREVSWRVEADVSVRDGYAWGSVGKGLHEMNDLYVGERLQYRVEVSDEILSYLGGTMAGCHLQFDSDEDALTFGPLKGTGNVYMSDVSCRKVCDGQLYLCGPRGEKLALLCRSVRVRLPEIHVAEYVSIDDDEPVEGLTYAPGCMINGSSELLYVYLTDSRQMNLNSSRACGFDLDAFDFGLNGVSGKAVLNRAFDAAFSKGVECSGGYAALMRLSCRHDGEDRNVGLALAESYSKAEVLSLVVADRNNGMTCRCGVSVGILPVTLTLVDNRWAGYHTSQLSVLVDNDSELPLEIIVCQMLDNNRVWYSSLLTAETKEYVERNLTRRSIGYITGSVNAYDQTMHVEGSKVQCVGSGAFPLNGIETTDLLKSLVYDRFGQDRMYHLVDVTAGGFQIYQSDISLVNSLSDGSSLYDTIYLSDWDSKGVWLYSDDALVSSAGYYLVHYPNLTPKRINRMRERYDSCPLLDLHMWYDGEEFRGYASNHQGVGYGLKMTVRFYGEVQGYVRTDPSGIWGAAKDNYCSASFDRTMKGVPLGDFLANISMDGGAVKQAMDAIYAQTFEDKKNGKKFQHSAHPVSMDCCVEISVEGEKGAELYPMRVSWEHPYVPYHHAQDDITYSCQMVASAPLFNMVLVDKNFSE